MPTSGEQLPSEDSMFAQLTGDTAVGTAAAPKTLTPENVFLAVAVASSAKNVSVSFDPVSVEEVRQTRELNRSVRLGFLPPAASTR